MPRTTNRQPIVYNALFEPFPILHFPVSTATVAFHYGNPHSEHPAGNCDAVPILFLQRLHDAPNRVSHASVTAPNPLKPALNSAPAHHQGKYGYRGTVPEVIVANEVGLRCAAIRPLPMNVIRIIYSHQTFPDFANHSRCPRFSLRPRMNNHINHSILLLAVLLLSGSANAQVLTKAQQLILTGEDSLSAGFDASHTVLSGYGSAAYQRDVNAEKGTAMLERAVLFVGHQFNRKWSFFSELELENGKVEGGEASGEIAMEQTYLRYNINPRHYIVAGLFVPRIGLLNENHLPVNFNGVERPLVETFVIPATWRELGIGWYGTFNRLQLSAAIMNGLSNSRIEHGTGIRDGRAEGLFAPANDVAVTAAVVYNAGDFRIQASGYAGGTTAINSRAADSLRLDGGAFGTPLFLGEANVKWTHEAFGAKALGAVISYPDAGAVNAAFGKNLPTLLYGYYAEAGFDVLYYHNRRKQQPEQLIAFARLEYIDLAARTPAPPRGIDDPTLAQRHFIAGLSFMPIPAIAIKADVRLLQTGAQNADLVINPAPNALAYRQDNTFLNIGIGYSF